MLNLRFIVLIFIVFLLSSCGQKKNISIGDNVEPNKITSNDGGEYSGKEKINKNIDDIIFSHIRGSKITSRELEKIILLGEGDDKIVNFYDKLISNVEVNIANENSIEKVVSSKGKKRIFNIFVSDYNGKPLSGVKVYLWGYYLGKTNLNGVLEKVLKIPRPYDYMYFQFYKLGYSPSYYRVSNIYYDGSLIRVKKKLKKAKLYKVLSGKININDKDVKININGDCPVVNSSGKCYKGDLLVNVSYIKPDEIDNLSLPMTAIKDGKLVHLMSNGMAYIDFYSSKGKKLLYNGKKAKICYNIGKSNIEKWEKSFKTIESKESNGYWYFDKSKGVWFYDKKAKFIVNKKDGTFCYYTNKVY